MEDNDVYYKRQYWKKRNKGGKKYPCPTCGRENMLTAFEKAQRYQCDACADAAEGVGGW